MPTFPSLRGGSVISTGGALTASSGGTSVVASASTNTKGSWVEFFSATAFEANGFYIFLRGSTNSCDLLYDIGIGAAASEQVIVANLGFSEQALRVAAGVYIPLRIPKGSRISIRCQSTVSAGSALFTMYLIAANLLQAEGFSQAVNMGANTADSGGTQVDPGGTINTKGAYSQLTAATTIEIGWLVICITNQNNGAETTNVGLIDIAIGAGGSEQVILADLAYCIDAAIDTPEPQYYGFPVSIPKGSRIAARAQCSINDATDRLIDITLIGLG
jgi:hypothetical protein